MTTVDLITELCCRIEDRMQPLPNHPQAHLWPSELVTVGVLHALTGVGHRAFYRWLVRDYRPLCPRLPERTRLFRLFKAPPRWTSVCLASPTLLGVVDSYGIEWLPPMREGRSRTQVGRQGKSTACWISGGKLCLLSTRFGWVAGGGWAPANLHDTLLHPLIAVLQTRRISLADTGFDAQAGDPSTLKRWRRGTWHECMVTETVLSMLTVISHRKQLRHRVAT